MPLSPSLQLFLDLTQTILRLSLSPQPGLRGVRLRGLVAFVWRRQRAQFSTPLDAKVNDSGRECAANRPQFRGSLQDCN